MHTSSAWVARKRWCSHVGLVRLRDSSMSWTHASPTCHVSTRESMRRVITGDEERARGGEKGGGKGTGR